MRNKSRVFVGGNTLARAVKDMVSKRSSSAVDSRACQHRSDDVAWTPQSQSDSTWRLSRPGQRTCEHSRQIYVVALTVADDQPSLYLDRAAPYFHFGPYL